MDEDAQDTEADLAEVDGASGEGDAAETAAETSTPALGTNLMTLCGTINFVQEKNVGEDKDKAGNIVKQGTPTVEMGIVVPGLRDGEEQKLRVNVWGCHIEAAKNLAKGARAHIVGECRGRDWAVNQDDPEDKRSNSTVELNLNDGAEDHEIRAATEGDEDRAEISLEGKIAWAGKPGTLEYGENKSQAPTRRLLIAVPVLTKAGEIKTPTIPAEIIGHKADDVKFAQGARIALTGTPLRRQYTDRDGDKRHVGEVKTGFDDSVEIAA